MNDVDKLSMNKKLVSTASVTNLNIGGVNATKKNLTGNEHLPRKTLRYGPTTLGCYTASHETRPHAPDCLWLRATEAVKQAV